MSPSLPIQVGIIGLGRSGWGLHMPSLARHRAFTITAVCDERDDRLALARAELGCAAYRDVREFLSHQNLELVIIATPTLTHVPYARAALERGYHVVLEKPLAPTAADAQELAALAQRQRRHCIPYYNFRFRKDFLRIRAWLTEGRIGTPFLIRRQVSYYNRRDDWQAYHEHQGGILHAATIHAIDQVLALGRGQASVAFADVRRLVTKGDAPDHSKVILTFDNGCIGDIEVSWVQELPGCQWMLSGPYGAIRRQEHTLAVRWFRSDAVTMGAASDRSYRSGEQIPWLEETCAVDDTCTEGYYDGVAHALREGGLPPVTFESALAAMRVVELLEHAPVPAHTV